LIEHESRQAVRRRSGIGFGWRASEDGRTGSLDSQRLRKGDIYQVNTQASERSVIDDVKRLLFVAGDWREAAGGQTMVVEDSSTGEALCNVADARPEDALAVLVSFSS
jgi:hypothetical protein